VVSLSRIGRALLIELRIILFIVFYVFIVLVLSFLQSLLLNTIFKAMVLGSLILLFLTIMFINMITAFILALSSHIIFNVVAPLHILRCSTLPTFDCRLTPYMLRYKIPSALTLLPLLLLALLAGNMVRLGLPLTPSSLIQAIVFGVEKLYGVLELSGYTLAYIAPLTGRIRVKLLLVTLALTMIMFGALIETFQLHVEFHIGGLPF